ncbi:putative nicotinate-nucleotide pyrophosphorylase [carboxylating] [bioreactor metagenome]|uniref:Probable nicotinate-nucleotide pyrophosphorylase [carboxylating] n=1 Tax=bioreactor metagenome TaxID=1076179 RepID=A0A644U8Z5_9ZZZZ|nr:carboxylating nicotinate-nucleotide diphosphorylase [Methanobrevibacter sp.]MEA4957602.1 carboxylating nicotinate-nucleotide diphosphorylase [Methanobrevibacter sp.]
MENIINKWIEEDIGFGDITTEALIPNETLANAKLISKQEGIVAGAQIVKEIFESRGLMVAILKNDGEEVFKNETIIEIMGKAKDILVLERVALNILMRMSGIATNTREIIDKINNIAPNLKIAGTRKTAPGLAKFDNLAITIGGGDSHRFCLDDMILIKDNHIAVLGSVSKAIQKAKETVSFTKKIEIEVENSKDAAIASKNGADIIMLDNMDPESIKETLEILNDFNLRENILIEISGGINSENIIEFAKTGVDIISIGSLTHSAKSLDIGLDISLEIS